MKTVAFPSRKRNAASWATVNKESGGGEESGSGRGRKESHASLRKGGAASGNRSAADRSAAARKGWETRRRLTLPPSAMTL